MTGNRALVDGVPLGGECMNAADCVRRLLDLSTAHLPPEMRAALALGPGVIAYPLDHGALMWVPDDPEDSAATGEHVP